MTNERKNMDGCKSSTTLFVAVRAIRTVASVHGVAALLVKELRTGFNSSFNP